MNMVLEKKQKVMNKNITQKMLGMQWYFNVRKLIEIVSVIIEWSHLFPYAPLETVTFQLNREKACRSLCLVCLNHF